MSKSGGLFDFNGDGKVSMLEDFLAYAIHESAMHSWRDTCENGIEFDLDPMDYETEEEYTDALEEAKYGWRDICEDGIDFDLDPEDYETEEEYDEALEEAKYGWRNIFTDRTHFPIDPECYETIDDYIDALVVADSTDQPPQQKNSPSPLSPKKVEKDNPIYTICGIAFPHAAHPYYYRTEDASLKIGDRVQLPAGTVITCDPVVSIGQYLREAAPFPIEQMKPILGKIDNNAK